MKRSTHITKSRRRGTATIEFVCSMVLLLVIIALTFFFGHVRVNEQHVEVASRYAAWVGWHTDINQLNVYWDRISDPDGEVWSVGNYLPTSADLLNSIFMDERSTETNLTLYWQSTETPDDYIQLTYQHNQQAGELIDEIVNNYAVPGKRAKVSAVFPSPVNLWEVYDGKLESLSTREGPAWDRGYGYCDEAVAHQFLNTLEDALSNIPEPGDSLGLTIRRLYIWPW